MSHRHRVAPLLRASWLIALTCCLMYGGGTPAAGDPPPPYRVHWPQGWEVTSSPTPTRSLNGERVRVQRMENGKIAAAIELTWFPRRSDKTTLDMMFSGMLKDLQEVYQSKGLTAKVTGLRPTALGSRSGQEADVAVTGRGVALRQWYGMAFSEHYIFSLTYTAQEANYDRYRDAFEQTRRSLVLK